MGFWDIFGLGDAVKVNWQEKGRETFSGDSSAKIKDTLIGQALGAGNSAAQAQLSRGLAQAQRQAQAQVAGQRGLTAAQQARLQQALFQEMALKTNEQSAMLRAQEQAQMLGMANQLQFEREQQLNSLSLQKATSDAGFEQQQNAARLGAWSSAISGAGTMISDERTKKNISEVKTDKVHDFLDKLKAYNYEYKKEYKDHPLANDHKNTGIMAQDLEKSDIGKTIVKEVVENGAKIKAVDTGRFVHALAASVANMNNRLNKLEK